MDEFELLCTDGQRANVMAYRDCHLAKVPTHAVITRPEKAKKVRELLERQEVSSTDSGRKVLGLFLCRMFAFLEQGCSEFTKSAQHGKF